MNNGTLMLDLEGLKLTAQEKETLKVPCVGGLILFARNYKNRQQLNELIADVREQRPDIIIAVDQEGGRVQRFRDEFVSLPPMFALHNAFQQDPELAIMQAGELGWLMAAEITSFDIDISFAPVLDLHWAHSQVIGTRSFGAKHSQVTALTKSFVQGMMQAGMQSTGKHFPGHGWASADSHLETAVDERSFEKIQQDDMQPFKRLIEEGLLGAVMPAHVIYSKVDNKPAGFSSIWLQQILRARLNFNGVIFSDDLDMNGANIVDDSDRTQYAKRAHAALSAGCDTVLVCNNPQAAQEVISYLEKEAVVGTGRLAKMRRVNIELDKERFDSAQQIAAQLLENTI
jgi:beta-N-acetylhexosaminidase